MTPMLLTKAEACRVSGLSRRKLQAAIDAGEILLRQPIGYEEPKVLARSLREYCETQPAAPGFDQWLNSRRSVHTPIVKGIAS